MYPKERCRSLGLYFLTYQFDKLEFGGESPLTMRCGQRQSNSILWAPRPIVYFALRMEFTAENIISHLSAEYTLAFRKTAVIDPTAVGFGNECFTHSDFAGGRQLLNQA